MVSLIEKSDNDFIDVITNYKEIWTISILRYFNQWHITPITHSETLLERKTYLKKYKNLSNFCIILINKKLISESTK